MIKDRKDALIGALKDQDESVRTEVAATLLKLEGLVELPEILKEFRSCSKRDKMRFIYALAHIRHDKSLVPLIHSVQNEDEDLKLAAVRAMGELGNPKAVPTLMDVLSGTSELIKIQAVESLGRIGDRSCEKALISLIPSGDEELDEATILALGKLQHQERRTAADRFACLPGPPDQARCRLGARRAGALIWPCPGRHRYRRRPRLR